MKTSRFGAFIARVQPPHCAHIEIIRKGLEQVEQLAVIIGSCHSAPNPKNPFSFAERKAMLEACFTEAELQRLRFFGVRDFPYSNTDWVVSVQNILAQFTGEFEPDGQDSKLMLFGHDKDRSTFYLNLFPQYGFCDTGLNAALGKLSATDIRRSLFEGEQQHWAFLPEPVCAYLRRNQSSPAFRDMVAEYQFLQQYRAAWRDAPYEPTFVTADAVVISSGHVLMIRRRGMPGRGLFALPGGFVRQHETLVEAAVRELREETGIRLTKLQLLDCLREQHTFDHPDRSLRGRTITQAFVFKIGENKQRSLPAIKSRGGSDADRAFWVSLRDVYAKGELIFEDHEDIIRHMSARITEREQFTFRAETTHSV